MKYCLAALVLSAVLLADRTAHAALPIELEVATEAGLALTAPQQWAKMLGQMNLSRVRLRGIRSGDRPEVTPTELGGRTRYRILAVLNSREELVLPDGRFRIGDRKALQTYFKQLSISTADDRAPRGRFDLTEKYFRIAHADLARPVGFSTKGMTSYDLLTRLEKHFSVPVVRVGITSARDAAPMDVELSEFSAGTALAIALRRDGMVLRPERQRGEGLRLTVSPYNRRRESWPVGWKSEASPRQVAPTLYDSLTLEIGNYTLRQALDALAPRIGVPVVMDDWILAERGIKPNEIPVKLARKKTFLKFAIDRLLSQARLAGEVRIDEQGQPFLWVTQFGKDSPHAAQ